MKQLKLISLLIFSISFSCFAIEDKSIFVSVYHDKSDIWNEIFLTNENDLITQLKNQLNEMGFENTDVQFCMQDDCQSANNSDLSLSMFLYDLKLGQRKKTKGLSFSLEMVNQREQQQAKKKLINLLSIKCRLTQPESKKLIGMNVSEQAVDKEYFLADKFDLQYVSEKLGEACVSVLHEQEMIALTNKGSTKKSTQYPGVYVEEKKIKTLNVNNPQKKPQKAIVAKTNTLDETEDTTVSVEKQVSTEEEETQYIIHNKASKVIIDFGHKR